MDKRTPTFTDSKVMQDLLLRLFELLPLHLLLVLLMRVLLSILL